MKLTYRCESCGCSRSLSILGTPPPAIRCGCEIHGCQEYAWREGS